MTDRNGKHGVSDADVMAFVDGELDATTGAAVEAELTTSPSGDGARKAEAIRELGQLVRGHLELATDAREARLAGMWREIDKQIDLRAQDDSTAIPAKPASRRAGAEPAAAQGWFARYRGYIATGALSAAAVAVLALVLRAPSSGPSSGTVAKVTPPVVVGSGGGPTPIGPVTPVLLPRVAPEVESVDVASGTGTVFTIEDEDGDTAVVWVTPEDTVEGI